MQTFTVVACLALSAFAAPLPVADPQLGVSYANPFNALGVAAANLGGDLLNAGADTVGIGASVLGGTGTVALASGSGLFDFFANLFGAGAEGLGNTSAAIANGALAGYATPRSKGYPKIVIVPATAAAPLSQAVTLPAAAPAARRL